MVCISFAGYIVQYSVKFKYVERCTCAEVFRLSLRRGPVDCVNKNKNMIIFTPTYNRSKLLRRLYDSLIRQTCLDFTWLIVDDGSTDNTHQQVEEWQRERKVNIHYEWQPNSGKHVAYNRALPFLNLEWNLCVDSDDVLDSHAVEQIRNDIQIIKNLKGVVGLAYPQVVIRSKYLHDADHTIVRSLRNITSLKEATRVFRPGTFKGISFPIFPNESYVGEEAIYLPVAEVGSTMFINTNIVQVEYQDEGLSSNYIKLWKENPLGTTYVLKQRVAYEEKYSSFISISKLKAILNLEAFNLIRGRRALIDMKRTPLNILLIGPSIVWRYIRFE